jgi:plasmid stabilization system protein ParE
MRKSFRLAPAAAEDIREIWAYIAEDSASAAGRFRLKLLGACRELGNNAGMGHKREDLAEERPLLFWPVGSYLIIYRAEHSPIEIVGVAHGARDIPAFLRRRTL